MRNRKCNQKVHYRHKNNNIIYQDDDIITEKVVNGKYSIIPDYEPTWKEYLYGALLGVGVLVACNFLAVFKLFGWF